jgi:site-specific DNA-methyltransferase (adenine-specific)
MAEVADHAVSLTVCSPPYWNAIDYDRHAQDDGQWYRTRSYAQGFEGYAQYLDLMSRVFREVLRVTKPGGFCCIVVGTCLFERRHIPVPFDLCTRLCAEGWEFHQDIVWHKCTAGVKRAGVVIQKPYPGYFYPNIMTEYILVLRKPGEPIFRGRSEDQRAAARFPINALFVKEIANNVWHIAPVPPGQLAHPCPFPEEIPFRLIRLYSHPGDTVLDPFLGSGQTAKVAVHLARHAVGYDTIAAYVDLAKSRLAEPLAVRREQLFAEFGKVTEDEPIAARGADKGSVRRRPRRKREIVADPGLFGRQTP